MERIKKMNEDHIEQHLRELLEGRHYLMVIDDVWHREAWEILRRALPDNKNGSRIIITTRIEAVAELLDERTYVHKLRFLRADESWELFCKKAFPEYNGAEGDRFHCPPDMEELGGEMVAKCGGLPLAITVLGGLLARKQTHEWVAVKEHIWRELKNNSIHVSLILSLSFQDLPYQLKPCFLYLGLFPEDLIFKAEKLIQLWVAEGFIPQEDEAQNLEEDADNYLKELIGRSLIQVVQRNWSTIATFRVHDLLRDLAVNKAREVNFLQIFYGSTTSTCTPSYRRLAFHSGHGNFNLHDHSYPHPYVRTLLFFNVIDTENLSHLKVLHKRYRLLRVLDLEGVKFYGGRLPKLIGNLIHLRYLGLKDTNISVLPTSIGNLQALQVLEASRFVKQISLPREICKLKQLRHLIGNFRAPLLLFEELKNLQSFDLVDVGEQLTEEEGEGEMFALNFLAKLSNLKFLSVQTCSSSIIGNEIEMRLQPLFHCRHLLKLIIDGRIENLPEELHKFLPNLRYLELKRCCFTRNPMQSLGMLRNLIFLHLECVRRNWDEYVLYTAKGFPQLQVLSITDGVRVEVQEGEVVMPRLRALSMSFEGRCHLPKRLRSLPDMDDLNWD